MLSKAKLQESIREIYKIYLDRIVIKAFTLESISSIFEIGNEVFQKNSPEELDRFKNRPQTEAPDILDDEPFALERSLEIYEKLVDDHPEITPELIQKIFELNSRLAWKSYRKRYNEYILKTAEENNADEYLNYLSAIVLYDNHEYDRALHQINKAIAQNASSANYTHIKSLCLMQRGEFETARTYLYQALFLVELQHDIPPRKTKNSHLYPNYPIEFHTSSELIRADLGKIDESTKVFTYQYLPLLEQ